MKKDQKVYMISGLSVIEGLFVSESNSYLYILNKETGIVSGYDKRFVFENKEEALESLVKVLKDKLSNITTHENRLITTDKLLDKLEKITEDFDLKKQSAK